MRALLWCACVLACALNGEARAAHGYAIFGDIKYPADLAHFEWVNPQAPKGGDIALVAPTRLTNFDKFNPFTLKGAAPAGLGTLVSLGVSFAVIGRGGSAWKVPNRRSHNVRKRPKLTSPSLPQLT